MVSYSSLSEYAAPNIRRINANLHVVGSGAWGPVCHSGGTLDLDMRRPEELVNNNVKAYLFFHIFLITGNFATKNALKRSFNNMNLRYNFTFNEYLRLKIFFFLLSYDYPERADIPKHYSNHG